MPVVAAAQTSSRCAAVDAAFASGSYDQREAIVDALQDQFKAGNADRALGRDGKVQAIMLALNAVRDRTVRRFHADSG